MSVPAKVWRFLSGKKTWIAVGGFVIEGAGYLLDNPPLVTLLPDKWQGAVNGGLSVLLAMGLLHRADKKDVAAEK